MLVTMEASLECSRGLH